MPILAVVFDLGGVLFELDQSALSSDRQRGIQKDYRSYERLNSELMAFLAHLRSHYKVATLCNGGSREAAERKFGLGNMVDLMVFDTEEGVSKPDARVYHIALSRLGVRPQEAVFVDDKMENVDAARVIGMVGIHFQNTTQTIAMLEAVLATASPSVGIPTI